MTQTRGLPPVACNDELLSDIEFCARAARSQSWPAELAYNVQRRAENVTTAIPRIRQAIALPGVWAVYDPATDYGCVLFPTQDEADAYALQQNIEYPDCKYSHQVFFCKFGEEAEWMQGTRDA